MIPDTLVRWHQGNVWLTGRIVSVNGTAAQVRANGSTYEVDKAAIFVVRLCGHCGKPLSGHNSYRLKFCSQACANVGRKTNICVRCGKYLTTGKSRYMTCQKCRVAINGEASDKLIFAAIVEYKRQYDGASPDNLWLMNRVGCSKDMIGSSLKRQVRDGKLRIEAAGNKRIIMVVGARWTFEEP